MAARERLLGSLRYHRVELGAKDVAGAVRALLDGSSPEPVRDALRPVAAYLALPPRLFVPAVTALGEVGLPHGSRIVVEKPFGESLEGARELTRLLRNVARDAGESAVFRRWAGTKFVLRAGKAMARRWKGVIIRYRPVPHLPFDAPIPSANELRIGLDRPENLSLHLTGSTAGPPAELTPLVLEAGLPAAELRAYSRVLVDVLSGGCTLSIRGDEAEKAWRIMTPVLDAWAADLVPLEEYPAGSAGPE